MKLSRGDCREKTKKHTHTHALTHEIYLPT